MSLVTILNILLGLAFTWSILSLAAMNIQEWLASRLEWRARMLHATITKLLTGSVLVDQFYNHPLIRSLFTGKDGKHKPSYIPSNQFSQVIIDILSTNGTDASLIQQQLFKLYSLSNHLPKKHRKKATSRISMILGMTRKALVNETGEDSLGGMLASISIELDTLGEEVPRLKEAIETAVTEVNEQKQQINEALAKMPYQGKQSTDSAVNRIRAGVTALSITHPLLKQTLFAILNTLPKTVWQKENELELIRSNIEEWFNNSMDRLTGWYKRRSQITVFLISMLIATIGNIDTVGLAHRLWDEPALRATILENVGEIIASAEQNSSIFNAGQILALQQNWSEINLPIGWLGSPIPLLDLQKQSSGTCTFYPTAENDLYGIWIAKRCYQIVNTPYPGDLTGWGIKLLGVLITAVAASQGASFWFDILKKIMNVRLSGFKPTQAQQAEG